MNEFRMRDDGAVLSEYDYRGRHPNVSLPQTFTPADADLVLLGALPAVTIYERAVRNGVEQVNGEWRQAWQVVPALVPESVPMLNARLALIEEGHMANASELLDAMPGVDGEKARTFFEFAQNVRRDHWVVEALRTALDLTSEQIDRLFILATTLD